jgi:hypothetical protein
VDLFADRLHEVLLQKVQVLSDFLKTPRTSWSLVRKTKHGELGWLTSHLKFRKPFVTGGIKNIFLHLNPYPQISTCVSEVSSYQLCCNVPKLSYYQNRNNAKEVNTYTKHKQNTQQTIYSRKHTEHRHEPTKESIKKNQVIKPKDAIYAI